MYRTNRWIDYHTQVIYVLPLQKYIQVNIADDLINHNMRFVMIFFFLCTLCIRFMRFYAVVEYEISLHNQLELEFCHVHN